MKDFLKTNRELFLQHVAQTSTSPLFLEFVKAQGIYLFNSKGKKYLDLISGISVSNLGHSHPKIISSIKKQLDKYMHLMVYGEYVQSPQVELAKLLANNLPKKLNSVYFTNSGAESTEGALKLVKRFTGRTEIIAFKNAYHGSTHGALSVLGNEYFKNSFRPLLPDVRFLNFNDDNDLKNISEKTACVIVETIQGEGGVIVPQNNFLKKLKKKCKEIGALLIIDEIQTGMGRTGTLFAFEQYGIVPDILLLAKNFGGGMPLGAFISSKKIMSALTENPYLGHITTFGGHPVCCAAALENLKILLKEKFIQQVKQKEKLFRRLLVHPKIRSVRSAGLLIAIEFSSYEENRKVIDRCIEMGLITDWFLFAPHCLRIAPPLIIEEREIRKACNIILESIDLLLDR